jgi:hypothetical protein
MILLRSFPVSLGLAALLVTSAHAVPTTMQTTPPATAAAPPKEADGAAAEKTFPAQATVAAKTTFSTITASDASVAKALDAKALTTAQKMVGKMGSFQGTVTEVYSPRTHSFVGLDFAQNYHDALSADIAHADYDKFPDLTKLEGKHVLVSGRFVARGEATQIAVTRPDQIKIIP